MNSVILPKNELNKDNINKHDKVDWEKPTMPEPYPKNYGKLRNDEI